MAEFFTEVSEPIRYAGPDSDDPLTFRWYDADRVVGQRTMAEHLRIAVCYWHSFNWPGNDVFGDGVFDRPWLDPALDPMAAARPQPERSGRGLALGRRRRCGAGAWSGRRGGTSRLPAGRGGLAGGYSSGNGSWSHHGRLIGSTRLTHFTHQKPRRPGATSRTGAPWPRRRGSPL